MFGGVLGLLIAPWAAIRWRKERPHRLAVAALLASIPALTLIIAFAGSRGAPPINDVTTDLEEPPAFLTLQAPYPGDFVPVVEEHYGDLEPFVSPRPPKDLYPVALELARGRGWSILAQDPPHRFQATDTSSLFLFVDDIVVRIQPFTVSHNATDEPRRYTRVDVRSRSRDGRGDMGINAARIRGFLQALEEAR